MERYFTFDDYNTYLDWHLVLTDKEISLPSPKTYHVELDGVDGSLDLSEALTGHMVYSDRTLKVTFWTDYGTRNDRVDILRRIRNALHGRKVKIVEPDDPEHYLVGRASITEEDNNMSYASIKLEALCEPYRYCVENVTRTVKVNDTASIVIHNNGGLTITPQVTVTATMTLKFGGHSVTLNKGTYRVTDLQLVPGTNVIELSGNGTATFIYKEGDI